MNSRRSKYSRPLLLAWIMAAMLVTSGCDLFVSAEARMARADKAAAESDFGLAEIEYRNVLQSQPDNEAARLKLVDILLLSGDVGAATAELEPLLKRPEPLGQAQDLSARIYLSRGDAKGLLDALESGRVKLTGAQQPLRKGQALLAVGRFQEAYDVFATVNGDESAVDEARMGKAQALAGLGGSGRAIAELDALLAAKPELARAWLSRGYLTARAGQSAEAESAFLQAKKFAKGRLGKSEHAGLLASLVEVQLARRDVAAATETAKQLNDLAPNTPVAILAQAQVDMAGGDATSAVSKLQGLTASRKDFLPARVLLGQALLQQKSLGQADATLSQLVADAPDNVPARKLLAQTKLQLNNPAKALEVLSPALRGAPGGRNDLSLLTAAAIAEAAKSPAAIAQLETEVAKEGEDGQLRYLLAQTYLKANDAAKAAELLRADAGTTRDARGVVLLLSSIAAAQGAPAAQAEAEKLTAANSEDVRVLSAIAEFHASQGQHARAAAVLERALAREPGNTGLMYAKAQVELAANDEGAAVEGLRKILASDPANVPASMQLAQLALRRRDYPTAVSLLRATRERHPTVIEPGLMLVGTHLQAGQAAAADQLAKEMLAESGGRADVANSLGELQLRAARHPQALAMFQQASKAQPRNFTYLLNVGRAQFAAQDFAGARATAAKSLELKPDDIGAVRFAALTEVKAGDQQAALDRVLAYGRKHTDDAESPLLEGDLRMELQQHKEAAAAYERALQKTPDSRTAVKAFRARSLGKMPEETAPVDRWLVQHPEDVAVRAVLAEHYKLAGDNPRAVAQYEAIIAIRPRDAMALNNVAWIYHLTKDARAERTAKLAYDEAPASPAIADTYGWILVVNGKAAEGAKLLAEAARRAPREPDIQYHYAVALARTGAIDEARQRLSQVLKDFPTFTARAEAEKALSELAEGTRAAS